MGDGAYVKGVGEKNDMEKISVSIESIPPPVLEVMAGLEKAGFQAYLVGGCVRDILLCRQPKDYDVATNARPDQVKSLFPCVIPTGEKYGTVTVRSNRRGTGERTRSSTTEDTCGTADPPGRSEDWPVKMDIEVTTYRKDGRYLDGRRPESVEFSDSLREDVTRRDFTVNALALDKRGKVLDHVGGLQDLDKRIIRCVGDPRVRFSEDALRMMRAIRLECQIEGEIETETLRAVRDCSSMIANVSLERVRDELCGILQSGRPARGIRLLETCGLLSFFLPELQACVGLEQRCEHHDKPLFEHIVETVGWTPPRLRVRLAALLHDIGKPASFSLDEKGAGHFYNHHLVGERMAKEILERLRFDSRTIGAVRILVREHTSRYDFLRPKSIKRFINRVGAQNMEDLFDLQVADIKASKPPHDLAKVLALKEEVERILARNEPLSVRDLAVTGRDLREWGMKPGKEMGDVLRAMLERALEDPSVNTKEGLRRVFEEMRG